MFNTVKGTEIIYVSFKMPAKEFVQYKASPKFKHIFSRFRKPHLTAVPKC